jgi:Chemotaxis signal transduction protein
MTDSFLLFCVDERRYALDVAAVERIVRAVEVTPVPDAPGYVRGLINVAGEIVPVIDIRQRLGLPIREVELSDRFILTNEDSRLRALLVDRVEGVVELPISSAARVRTPILDTTTTAINIEGNIVLIQTKESLLSEATPLRVGNIRGENIID